MAIATRQKTPVFGIGVILVAASYLLLAPTFLFAALGLAGKAWLWCRLAGATYVLSWMMFLGGIALAGPDAIQSGRLWLRRLLTRKTTSNPATDGAAPAEDTPPDAQ